MLQSERIDDLEEAIRVALRGQSATEWHCLPGIVQSFNAAQGTCVVQIAIQMSVRKQDAQTLQWVSLPLLQDVPVIFPRAGNFVLTFPVQQGDEALIIFADRCIDNWWYLGGVQQQLEVRLHDLSDGFAFIGPFSKPNVPANISTSTVQLRTIGGATFLEMDSANNVNIHANVNITGNLMVSGTTQGTGDGQFAGIHVAHHHHGGVTPGGGSTGEPIDG